LGDCNYWASDLKQELQERDLELLAPPKQRAQDPEGWGRWLPRKRRRVEMIIGQLVERFGAKRTWARDLWHLGMRVYRKVLSYTLAVYLNLRQGGEPL